MTRVHILGTHGVPAAYGGFETAAQEVGLHLRDRGWDVVVYCQLPGTGPTTSDQWHGLTRVLVHEAREGWKGTAAFDLTTVRHVLGDDRPDDVCLTFGYNTGVFNLAQRLRGIPNVINMDGMEWTRRRWGLLRQGILLANERMAGLVGDVLVADHPVIATYLRRHFGSSRVATITYGAHPVDDAPTRPVEELGLAPGAYATMICRPIPENSCLEIVRAWSARDRGIPLVVLGAYDDTDAYHRSVREAAGPQVRFVGAIHDPAVVGSLRRHSRLYLHGHTVGGTNPSLVEAMAARNPVVAHANRYNTWVAGDAQLYFGDEAELDAHLTRVVDDPQALALMGRQVRARFEDEFTWARIGDQYEQALLRAMARRGRSREIRVSR